MTSPKNQQDAQPAKPETPSQTLARTITSPECLSASVLTVCQRVDHSNINELVGELKRQSAAVNADDLSRAEDMLTAQAHTLDGLFARLTSDALSASDLDKLERYMKLAFKAQHQARAALQTLVELKAPKHLAFVQQANIGNQVQVNNEGNQCARVRKNEKAPNELMEEGNGERLDARTASKTGRTNQTMAPVGAEHGAKKR